MRRHLSAVVLAVLGLIACFMWAPWMQLDSRGGSTSLGFAPVWTTDFRLFPGATVDTRALATHVVLALIFAALIAMGQALRRQN